MFVTSAEEVTKRFGAATFDVITAIELVEHLKNPKQALIDFHMALKNNGLFILTTPSPETDAIFSADSTHISVKPVDEWKRVLKEIGFDVFTPFYFGTFLKTQRTYVPKMLQKVLDSNFHLSVSWRRLYAIIKVFKARSSPIHIFAIKH